MQEGRLISMEDIQKERLLHSSIVEKCDLITTLFIENKELKRQLNEVKKDGSASVTSSTQKNRKDAKPSA